MTATYNADSAWDATSSPGYFYEGASGQVSIYDNAYGANGLHAWVGGGCDADDIWNTPLGLYYNQSYMDAFSASKKKAVAVHELGHVYGLAHTEHWDCHDQLWHGESWSTAPGHGITVHGRPQRSTTLQALTPAIEHRWRKEAT
jgi:hypothetical protein